MCVRPQARQLAPRARANRPTLCVSLRPWCVTQLKILPRAPA
nr:MAG TPA: hypothetical protein [Caudoviricetes sp.]DAM14088.1 MAG TPA: hypothetical protein [Caudoviricetes sp.]